MAATAATQVQTFVGAAPGLVVRRMVLHQRAGQAAGGVDAFVIGTELRGTHAVRSRPAYPASARSSLSGM